MSTLSASGNAGIAGRDPVVATTGHDTVLVIDLGAQYANVIARRVRERHIYSEIVPHDISAAELTARAPSGHILSGGPASVYADNALRVDPGLFTAGIPVLGICYGHQLLAQALGGEVTRTGRGEYGRTALRADPDSVLLAGQPAAQTVWMSHGDAVTRAPDGFRVIAHVDQTEAILAFRREEETREARGERLLRAGHIPAGDDLPVLSRNMAKNTAENRIIEHIIVAERV